MESPISDNPFVFSVLDCFKDCHPTLKYLAPKSCDKPDLIPTYTASVAKKLAWRIKSHQQSNLQPVYGYPCDNKRFKLITGAERLEAARLTKTQVPVFVAEFDDTQRAFLAAVDPIICGLLNPVDEAKGYRFLLDNYTTKNEYLNHSTLSALLNVKRSYLANTLRLLKLPEDVQSFIVEGALSFTHARVLLKTDNTRLQSFLASHTIKGNWSTRELEKAMTFYHSFPTTPASSASDEELRQMEKAILHQTGVLSRINLRKQGSGGFISFNFDSDSDFHNVLARLGVSIPDSSDKASDV